jgi:hypothetical protein
MVNLSIHDFDAIAVFGGGRILLDCERYPYETLQNISSSVV